MPHEHDIFRRGRSPSRRLKARGFTLIELLIAMVIVAILASIAIPSYQAYVLRSHRTDAKSALLDMASLEERFFSTNNTYSQTPTDLGYTGAVVPFTIGQRLLPDHRPHGGRAGSARRRNQRNAGDLCDHRPAIGNQAQDTTVPDVHHQFRGAANRHPRPAGRLLVR